MGESNSQPATPFRIEFVDENGQPVVDAAEGKDLSGPPTDGKTQMVIDVTRFDFDQIVLGRGKNGERVPSGRRRLRPRTKA